MSVEKASAMGMGKPPAADTDLASTTGVDLASPQAWMWHLPPAWHPVVVTSMAQPHQPWA